MGTCRTLRVPDLEDRVIFDFMEVLGRPQGSYPEVSCQYLYRKGVKNRVPFIWILQ